MSIGAANTMGASGVSLRLLSFGQAPNPAPIVSVPAATSPTPRLLALAATSPVPAPAPGLPDPVVPTETPRLLSYQLPAQAEQALEAVRLEATSVMSNLMNTLTAARTALLPALAQLRDSLSSAAPAPAPAATEVEPPKAAPATAPSKPKPKPGSPSAPKPRPKPKPYPKPKKSAATDFQDTLGMSNQRLAKVLDISGDSARKNLPVIAQAIHEAGIKNKNAVIAILATIKTEVGSFMPINEYGGPSYWARYNGRSDLGNRRGTNDGVTYHGRGYIQLTGRANYQSYGSKIGVDLVNNPNKALDPKVASKVLVQYFEDRGLVTKAAEGDWLGVRKGVNGGTNGWDRFSATVSKLRKAVGA